MSRLSDTPHSDAKDDEDPTDTPPTEPLDAPSLDEEHNHHDADPPEQLSEAESNPPVGEPSAETVETPDEPTDLEPPTSHEDDALDAFEAAWRQTLHDDTDPDPSDGAAHLRDFTDHYDAPADAPDNDVPRSGDAESADDNPTPPEDTDTAALHDVDATPTTRPEAGESADDGSPPSPTETREPLDAHHDIATEQAFETAWTDLHTKEPTDDDTRAERAHLTDFVRRYAPEDAAESPKPTTDARTETPIMSSRPEDHPTDTSHPSDRADTAKREGPVDIETCDRTDKFKVPHEWLDAHPGAALLLAEYDHGTLYRAYHPDSTIHQSGDQHVTALLFFPDEAAMTHYIADHNLPTEKYHAYAAHELTNGTYAITDFKLRYNQVEQTAYITLPLENGAVKDTTLRIGDTVNFTLHDTTTDATHHISLHKILTKEDNYCAIRLTPTATDYYRSEHGLDKGALLATGNISMHIERVQIDAELQSIRYAHVNLAKPALMEHVLREPEIQERLRQQLGYDRFKEIGLHLGPYGLEQPDVQMLAIRQLGDAPLAEYVIGECKAHNAEYSGKAVIESAIQLLYYKSLSEYSQADRGLLFVTGNPEKPSKEQLAAAINSFAEVESDRGRFRQAHHLAELSRDEIGSLLEWHEQRVTLIDGAAIREMILQASRSKANDLAIMNFIEK